MEILSTHDITASYVELLSGNFGQKSPKLSKMLFSRPALFELLFLMQTYSLKQSGIARTKISTLLLWLKRSYQPAQVRNQSST